MSGEDTKNGYIYWNFGEKEIPAQDGVVSSFEYTVTVRDDCFFMNTYKKCNKGSGGFEIV